jgi:hypothetical protein
MKNNQCWIAIFTAIAIGNPARLPPMLRGGGFANTVGEKPLR